MQKNLDFEISELEILDSGNIQKGITAERGKITSDNQIEITSNSFEYSKIINSLDSHWSRSSHRFEK